MKKPTLILVIGLFFILIWLYTTDRISGILCWILCAILFALAFTKEAALRITSLDILMGAALGMALVSQSGKTMAVSSGEKAVEAIECATEQFVFVSNAHGRKLRLEILADFPQNHSWDRYPWFCAIGSDSFSFARPLIFGWTPKRTPNESKRV